MLGSEISYLFVTHGQLVAPLDSEFREAMFEHAAIAKLEEVLGLLQGVPDPKPLAVRSNVYVLKAAIAKKSRDIADRVIVSTAQRSPPAPLAGPSCSSGSGSGSVVRAASSN